MKYYVVEDGALTETSAQHYEQWMLHEGKQYILPNVELEKDGFLYTMETLYRGAMDEGESLTPFVLLFFKDHAQTKQRKIKSGDLDSEVEFFEAFDKLVERRKEVTALFKKGIFPEV